MLLRMELILVPKPAGERKGGHGRQMVPMLQETDASLKGRALSTGSSQDPCGILKGGRMPNENGTLSVEQLIKNEALWLADKLDWKVRLGQITSDHASLIVRVIEAPVLKILDEWYGGEMSAGDSVGRLREINNAIDILTR